MDPVFEAVALDRSQGVIAPDRGATLVNVARIQQDERPGTLVHEPGHPDANEAGYVEYPNVHAVEEMVNMITASRAYEAGITSIETIKQMAHSAIGIGS
jgi:flagellar basal-body rod protein FlgC